MKFLVIAAMCAAMSVAGMAKAEMVELDHSNDGLLTLRGMVGSLKSTPKGATAVFGWTKKAYEGDKSADVRNFRVSVAKATCKAGAGNLRFTTLAGEGPSDHEWVQGDGSLADSIATVLCSVYRP